MSKIGLKRKGSEEITSSPVLMLLKYLNLFLSGEGKSEIMGMCSHKVLWLFYFAICYSLDQHVDEPHYLCWPKAKFL